MVIVASSTSFSTHCLIPTASICVPCRLQEDARANKNGVAQRKVRLLSALQSLYSSGRVPTSVGEGEGEGRELMGTEPVCPSEDTTGTDTEPPGIFVVACLIMCISIPCLVSCKQICH